MVAGQILGKGVGITWEEAKQQVVHLFFYGIHIPLLISFVFINLFFHGCIQYLAAKGSQTPNLQIKLSSLEYWAIWQQKDDIWGGILMVHSISQQDLIFSVNQ